jgi:hypothetical protein
MRAILEQLGVSFCQSASFLDAVSASRCFDLATMHMAGVILAVMGLVVAIIWIAVRRSSAL